MAGKKGQKKRFWSDNEKRSICNQARAPGVSVAQVARRYSMNANLIHKWLRDPRFASSETEPEDDIEVPEFFEVSVTAPNFPAAPTTCTAIPNCELSATRVDITLSDGRRILIEGSTSLMAVVTP
ncbi:transposase [uncultured Roseobacter sp.]|uniref:IS66-like element accessory protein TnpA n=1 Tax=uncultured Roseobacter sp. TaxID=114847 RepID=UPI00261ED99E|nr:transposase [uncultured Roseobacter sp.]